MQVVRPEFVKDKRVLLRMDLDVPLSQTGGKLRVAEDFRLLAGLDTLELCLEYARSVIIMGHLGRPAGRQTPELSVAPIVDWLEALSDTILPPNKLHILENLRFEEGEEACGLNLARELASLGDVYINEAFAAHHPAASTTILPGLLPHAAGLRFAREVEELTQVREHPDKPLVVIIGGVKLEDKLPAVEAMARVADKVLVGGKIGEMLSGLPPNVIAGKLNREGTDIAEETARQWSEILAGAKTILWNGPLGQVEDEKNDQTRQLAQAVINSGSRSIVGGGDTVAALNKWKLLDRFSFVSTGGGAMLKFLATGSLPTIKALG